MENNINITEILKDCPKGMELDCAMFDDVHFDYIDDVSDIINCYIQNSNNKTGISFNKYGHYSSLNKSKCVIFPKGKTTWEGFVPPCNFKNGDVIFKSHFVAIVSDIMSNGLIWYHCWYDTKYKKGKFKNDFGIGSINDGDEVRLATEEEKEKLFQAIKDNGYKWNVETKTLEKLPKFKVGNRIKYINGKNKDGVEQGVILSLTNDTYDVAVTNDMGIFIPISEQDDWELVPDKFDINTLKPFDKVLVRDKDTDTWEAHLFSRYYKNSDRPYICIGVEGINEFNQCIPYDSNKELLGTTDNCDKFYKTWE